MGYDSVASHTLNTILIDIPGITLYTFCYTIPLGDDRLALPPSFFIIFIKNMHTIP